MKKRGTEILERIHHKDGSTTVRRVLALDVINNPCPDCGAPKEESMTECTHLISVGVHGAQYLGAAQAAAERELGTHVVSYNQGRHDVSNAAHVHLDIAKPALSTWGYTFVVEAR